MSEKQSRAARQVVKALCASAQATGCDQPADPDSRYGLCVEHTRYMRFMEPAFNSVLRQIQEWVVQYHAQAHGQPVPATQAQTKATLVGPGGKVIL